MFAFFSCDDGSLILDRSRAAKLEEKFEIEGIPTLVILSADGKIVSKDGTGDVRDKGLEALQLWSNSNASVLNEHKWIGVSCHGCQMNPLVGERYNCSTCDNYDLCAACQKKGHPHELKSMPQSSSTIGNLVWKGINFD